MGKQGEEMYQVQRHGGRRTDRKRTIYSGDDLEEARRAFEKAANEMGQGRAILVGPEGVIKEAWAPRLRTRW